LLSDPDWAALELLGFGLGLYLVVGAVATTVVAEPVSCDFDFCFGFDINVRVWPVLSR
jgi:hypothetical protein